MALSKVITQDSNLQKIQDNVDKALTPIQRAPLVGGRMLSSVSLSSGPNSIIHNLGYAPTKWVITDINAASSIYRSAADNKTITLNSSAPCKISVWVT